MNWLDITLLVAIALSAFVGLKVGVIKASLSLAGLILGVLLAGLYYQPLSELLTFIPHQTAAKVVAFILILVGVLLLASLLALLLKWAAQAVMLSWANHLGGAIFGLLLGGLLCGALLAVWIKYLGTADVITHSRVAPILLNYFPRVLELLPEEFGSIRSFF